MVIAPGEVLLLKLYHLTHGFSTVIVVPVNRCSAYSPKIVFYAKSGSDPGLLYNPAGCLGRLKICGRVNKEKGFAKRFLKNACKIIL